MTRLRYSDVFAMTSLLGVLGKQVYRWNSTFDPDLTNVGHQPLYRDTYASIYDQYSVVSAKAHIRLMNYNATAPFAVGCVTDDDATAASNLNVLTEQSHGMSRLLSPLSGNASNVSFDVTWDCGRILGIDPFASETYKTAVGSNPTEESDLIIWVQTLDGSTALVAMQIVLEQEVLWTELQTPVQS